MEKMLCWFPVAFHGFSIMFLFSLSKSIILTQSLAFCTEAKYEKVLMMHVWGCYFAAPSFCFLIGVLLKKIVSI